ncbi:hypothetical protein F4809DRAFT_656718 [Biscogniauxia mediterranea]|nr:hypothetical protein F4809DRAFT_656718 [Biscogniauxia mediterranea]
MSVPTEQGLPGDSPLSRSFRGPSSPKKPATGFFKPPVKISPTYSGKLPRGQPVPDQVPRLSPGAQQPHVLRDGYNPEPHPSSTIHASGSPSAMMANHNNPSYPGFYQTAPRGHLREEGNGTDIEQSGVQMGASDVNVDHPNPLAANHNIYGSQRPPSSPTTTENSLGPDNSVRTEHGWHVTQQFLRDSNVVTSNGDIPDIGDKFLPSNITPMIFEVPTCDPTNMPASQSRLELRLRRQMFLAGELFKAGVVGPFMIQRKWVIEINERGYYDTIGYLKMRDGELVWLDGHKQPIGCWGNLPLVDMKGLVDECLGRMGRKQWVDATTPAPQLPEEYYDSDPGGGDEEDEEEGDENEDGDSQ